MYAIDLGLPALDEVLDAGWTTWDGTEEMEIANGDEITVAEIVTATKKAVKAGITTVVANT